MSRTEKVIHRQKQSSFFWPTLYMFEFWISPVSWPSSLAKAKSRMVLHFETSLQAYQGCSRILAIKTSVKQLS